MNKSRVGTFKGSKEGFLFFFSNVFLFDFGVKMGSPESISSQTAKNRTSKKGIFGRKENFDVNKIVSFARTQEKGKKEKKFLSCLYIKKFVHTWTLKSIHIFCF